MIYNIYTNNNKNMANNNNDDDDDNNENANFSLLNGIDNISIQCIIPYLKNDSKALINMFALSTTTFLKQTNVDLRKVYYGIILPRKYSNNNAPNSLSPIINGCKQTLKDTTIFVNELEKGYDINVQVDNGNGQQQNVLHVASVHGHLSIITFLIEHFHANINVLDGEGKSAIFKCI